jgi:hypothetical protein
MTLHTCRKICDRITYLCSHVKWSLKLHDVFRAYGQMDIWSGRVILHAPKDDERGKNDFARSSVKF